MDTIKNNLMELRIAFSELQKVKTVHSVVSVAGKSSDSDAMECTDGTSKRSRSFSEEEEAEMILQKPLSHTELSSLLSLLCLD